MNKNRPLVYLACPYSHEISLIRAYRFDMANRVAGRLMQDGEMVFSSISHTHPIAESCDLPKGFDFWEKYDRAVLSCCNKVVVLCIRGWRESVGVQAEIRIAGETGIPVEYIDVEGRRVEVNHADQSDVSTNESRNPRQAPLPEAAA